MNKEIIGLIKDAEKPIVYFGNGCRDADWLGEVVAHLEHQAVPYIVNCHAHGIIKSSSEFFLGSYGYGANGLANNFIDEYKPDLIFFLGSQLGEVVTSAWSEQLRSIPNRIHVDRKLEALNRNFSVNYPIVMELRDFSDILLCIEFRGLKVREAECRSILKKIDRDLTVSSDGENGIHPGRFLQILSSILPSDAVMFTDIGNSMMWSIGNLEIRQSQDFYYPVGLASMGSGLCGAMGAKAANPQRTVCALVGDATMMMHGNELLSSKINNLPVKIFVLNDGGHGMVHHGQKMIGMPVRARFEDRVNFKVWANGLGLTALRIENSNDLNSEWFMESLESDESVVYDLIIDKEIMPPIGNRAKMFQEARAEDVR